MGEQTDKIAGRAKQAVGAVTGDEETKREGERQEDKGKLKGKVDSAIDTRRKRLGISRTRPTTRSRTSRTRSTGNSDRARSRR